MRHSQNFFVIKQFNHHSHLQKCLVTIIKDYYFFKKIEAAMKYATFTTEVKPDMTIQIPPGLRNQLKLEPGNRVEISLKKIKSSKLDLILAENPLHKLIELSRIDNSSEEL
jgi:hypothetical protein